MNKKIFGVLASLFTAGFSVPFTYAGENTSGTEFMTGISNAKVTNYIDFKSLNDKEQEFKGFCNEILKEKSGNYSKYSEKWLHYIATNKAEMEEHRKQLNHLLTIGKFMILSNVKPYIKNHHEMLEGMPEKERTEKLMATFESSLYLAKVNLVVCLANEYYCKAWLDYAEENSNLLQFNKDNLHSISNYPNYDYCLKLAQGKIDSWYNDLFKNENK